MDSNDWKTFFLVCAEILGRGSSVAAQSDSWCSWTTFARLNEDTGYWMSGLPKQKEIADAGIADGGTWGQPFSYSDLAHVLIPRSFYWESSSENGFKSGVRKQDIDAVALRLQEQKINHRLTDLVLEIKLY